MAKERTEASRYESRYGGNAITPAQFIAELMCERLAKKDKKDLPVKFWNLPTWKRTFLQQVLAANTLLKVFSPKAILQALKREPKVFSLRAPWFTPVVQEEQQKCDVAEAKQEAAPPPVVETKPPVVEQPRPTIATKKSILNKLREYE